MDFTGASYNTTKLGTCGGMNFQLHPSKAKKTCFQIFPYGSKPLFALAGSHSHAGRDGGDGSPSPALQVDISLLMHANHHHRQGPAIRIAAVPFPGQHVRHRSLPHDSFPSGHQRLRGVDASVIQATICRAQERWIDALPLVFLGMRTTFKEDLQASVAELVYGNTLRIAGKLLATSTTAGDQFEVNTHLRRHFEQLRQVPAARHASPAVFIHKDLADSTHVFLRQDAVRRLLDPPYSGPTRSWSARRRRCESP